MKQLPKPKPSTALALLWLLFCPPTLGAGDSTADGAKEQKPSAKNLCIAPDLEKDAWIDRMRKVAYRTVCGSAVWFDGFFGDEIAYEESDASFGRLGGNIQWDEFNGFKLRGSLKVKLTLPRFEKKVNAFVGRFDGDDFVADRSQGVSGLPSLFQEQTDQEWLAGLGYNPLRSARSRLDFDIGVDLDTPIDPFVKTRYRYNFFVNDRSLLRYRQTLFWRNQDGYGTTGILDFERLINSRFHSRWRGIATFSESTEGVDWQSTYTVYQYIGGTRALAYRAFIDGESDAPVSLYEYGFETLYRQNMAREWLFLEVGGRVFWPRQLPDEARETTYGLSLGFEMLFGHHP